MTQHNDNYADKKDPKKIYLDALYDLFQTGDNLIANFKYYKEDFDDLDKDKKKKILDYFMKTYKSLDTDSDAPLADAFDIMDKELAQDSLEGKDSTRAKQHSVIDWDNIGNTIMKGISSKNIDKDELALLMSFLSSFLMGEKSPSEYSEGAMIKTIPDQASNTTRYTFQGDTSERLLLLLDTILTYLLTVAQTDDEIIGFFQIMTLFSVAFNPEYDDGSGYDDYGDDLDNPDDPILNY